jgi:hypothetical protein
MISKKPAPDLIRGGNRFSDKIMRKAKCMIPKSWTKAPVQARARLTGCQGIQLPWLAPVSPGPIAARLPATGRQPTP